MMNRMCPWLVVAVLCCAPALAGEWVQTGADDFADGLFAGAEIDRLGQVSLASFRGVNLALDAVASSGPNTLSGRRSVTDGDADTEWRFNNEIEVLGEWIRIDLGGDRGVSQVRVLPGKTVAQRPLFFVKGYRLEVAREATPDDWILVAQQAENTRPTVDTSADSTWLETGADGGIDRDGLESEVVGVAIHILPDVQAERLRVLEKDLRGSVPIVPSRSLAMQQVMQEVAQVAESDMTVLVLGETGVGKGLLARTMHGLSPRREHAFIPVNCGGLSAGLVESELFGHEKGAFTGAASRKIGFFERAHGGTLFLDEIGDLPLDAQRTLLHILEENHLTRVGGGEPVAIDVRVVAATNRDLRQAVQEGAFRQDLFYRLNRFPLVLPPLRDRQEDIPTLAVHFVAQFAAELQRSVPSIGDAVIAHLQAYSWPGNVRELDHLMQRAVVVCQDGVIQVADVPLAAEEESLTTAAAPIKQGGDDKDEKQQILAALQATNWMVYGKRGAAHLLGMKPERLRSRMRVYGLKKPEKLS